MSRARRKKVISKKKNSNLDLSMTLQEFLDQFQDICEQTGLGQITIDLQSRGRVLEIDVALVSIDGHPLIGEEDDNGTTTAGTIRDSRTIH